MITETRIISLFGAKHEATVLIPESNEEYNAYSDAVSKAIESESEELLMLARVKYYDLWVTDIKGRDKSRLPDRIKSGLMFQIYEKTNVTEKN